MKYNVIDSRLDRIKIKMMVRRKQFGCFGVAVLCVTMLMVDVTGETVADVAIDTNVAKDCTTDEAPPANARYRDASLPIEERIDDLLKYLKPEEKTRILHASGGMSMGHIPRIGLSVFRTLDAGMGPRAMDRPGVTYLPAPIANAATWDKELVEEIGRVCGEETRAVYPDDVDGSNGCGRMLLGPGINIARTPLCARNFEYAGEDPVLAGKIAAAWIRGLQGVGVAACAKHYVLNDSEYARTTIDVSCPERALHEIYIRPFEIAVTEGGAWSVMGSLSKVQGVWASWNWKLNRILMEDLHWDGALIPDWSGWKDDVGAINGGTTIETACGENAERDRREVALVESGKIDTKRFEDAVRRALRLYFRVGAFDRGSRLDTERQKRCEKSFASKEHDAIARRAAEESFVLVRNESGFLPVDKDQIRKVAVIGPNAVLRHGAGEHADFFDRGGSGAVKARQEVTPLEGFVEVFGADRVIYSPGFLFSGESGVLPPSVAGVEVDDVLVAAQKADLVVFCGGIDHSLDREAGGGSRRPFVEPNDRKDIYLKSDAGFCQEDLIRQIASVNPNLVVALTGGAPLSVEEWYESVKAIFITWYGGAFGGRVLADMVTGSVNPSGKLPYTYGKSLRDWPVHRLGSKCYPGHWSRRDWWYYDEPKVEYLEGIWVGYRGFDRFHTNVRYAFGFGLSYTQFKISPAEVHPEEDRFAVLIRNAGSCSGRTVVQCYISKPMQSYAEMPEKELADFASVVLRPGEVRQIEFQLDKTSYRYWDEKENGWRIPKGLVRIRIGESSDNLPVTYEKTIE